jgi:hypothetical protein
MWSQTTLRQASNASSLVSLLFLPFLSLPSHSFCFPSKVFKRRFATGGSHTVTSSTASNGIRVVSVNSGAPITTVNVVVEAGTRHEGGARGTAHVVRNLSFLVSWPSSVLNFFHLFDMSARSSPTSFLFFSLLHSYNHLMIP